MIHDNRANKYFHTYLRTVLVRVKITIYIRARNDI